MPPVAKLKLGIGADGALVDVSGRLLRFETARGRPDELSAIAPGTCRLRLENSDRALEPEYAGSPWYPNVEPDAAVVLSAVWAGIEYPIFDGDVGDILPGRRSVTGAYVDIPCVDALERFNANTIVHSFAGGDLAGDRVAALLDLLGDTATRSLAAGASRLAAEDVNGDGLAALQAAAGYGLGVFFVGKDGARVFQDRHARLLATVPVYVFGDDPDAGEIPYTAAAPAVLKQEIVNSWTVGDGTTSATAEDAASIGKRGRRAKQRTAKLALDDELRQQAHFLLSQYLAPALRFRQLFLHGDARTFEAMLALELGDRVKTRQRPAGGGDPLDKDGYVERIALVHERGIRWTAQLRLSPASRWDDYWIAGVSHADVDTRGAY